MLLQEITQKQILVFMVFSISILLLVINNMLVKWLNTFLQAKGMVAMMMKSNGWVQVESIILSM